MYVARLLDGHVAPATADDGRDLQLEVEATVDGRAARSRRPVPSWRAGWRSRTPAPRTRRPAPWRQGPPKYFTAPSPCCSKTEKSRTEAGSMGESRRTSPSAIGSPALADGARQRVEYAHAGQRTNSVVLHQRGAGRAVEVDRGDAHCCQLLSGAPWLKKPSMNDDGMKLSVAPGTVPGVESVQLGFDPLGQVGIVDHGLLGDEGVELHALAGEHPPGDLGDGPRRRHRRQRSSMPRGRCPGSHASSRGSLCPCPPPPSVGSGGRPA